MHFFFKYLSVLFLDNLDVKTDPRPTRSEVIVRRDKFNTQYFHVSMQHLCFYTQKYISKKSYIIVLDIFQLIFLVKIIFTTLNFFQDLYKSRRCGFVEAATEGKCNNSHFIIIIANKATKQNISFASLIRLEYSVCYQVAMPLCLIITIKCY